MPNEGRGNSLLRFDDFEHWKFDLDVLSQHDDVVRSQPFLWYQSEDRVYTSLVAFKQRNHFLAQWMNDFLFCATQNKENKKVFLPFVFHITMAIDRKEKRVKKETKLLLVTSRSDLKRSRARYSVHNHWFYSINWRCIFRSSMILLIELEYHVRENIRSPLTLSATHTQ